MLKLRPDSNLPSNAADPLVSVVIPTRNHAKFLPESIGSAIAQTYLNLEILVLDNASTDNTTDVVLSIAKQDNRVRYIRNETDIGLAQNFNRGISLASGDYINILCADDLIEPVFIQKMIEAFRETPGVALAGCARQQINTNGISISAPLAFSSSSGFFEGPETIIRCLLHGNLIGEPSAVLFLKNNAQRGFSLSYSQLIDLEFWFLLLESGSFAFVAEPLCKVRRHEGQMTLKNLLWGKAARDEMRIYLDYARKKYVKLSSLKRAKLILRRLIFCISSPFHALAVKTVSVLR
ncbi:MAG: glycosyltransferase family 2 protein [Clostridiales bacterium]|nr:glycosyltransferase family 2 protein [Clostridiales bacterium]